MLSRCRRANQEPNLLSNVFDLWVLVFGTYCFICTIAPGNPRAAYPEPKSVFDTRSKSMTFPSVHARMLAVRSSHSRTARHQQNASLSSAHNPPLSVNFWAYQPMPILQAKLPPPSPILEQSSSYAKNYDAKKIAAIPISILINKHLGNSPPQPPDHFHHPPSTEPRCYTLPRETLRAPFNAQSTTSAGQYPTISPSLKATANT